MKPKNSAGGFLQLLKLESRKLHASVNGTGFTSVWHIFPLESFSRPKFPHHFGWIAMLSVDSFVHRAHIGGRDLSG